MRMNEFSEKNNIMLFYKVNFDDIGLHRSETAGPSSKDAIVGLCCY